MKIEIFKDENKEFKPFEVKILIESELDLAFLWASFNTASPVLIGNCEDKQNIKIKEVLSKNKMDGLHILQMSMFNFFNEMARQNGMKANGAM